MNYLFSYKFLFGRIIPIRLTPSSTALKPKSGSVKADSAVRSKIEIPPPSTAFGSEITDPFLRKKNLTLC